MNITIFTSNLSSNATGRSLLLAQSLAVDHRVKIVGPLFGKDVWRPAANANVAIDAVPGAPFPGFIATAKRIMKIADGDVFIACKPLLPSLGIALATKVIRRSPVILDMDDDELAMTEPGKHSSLRSKLKDPMGYLYTRIAHRLSGCADGYFSIAESYRAKFGGVVVPHGKDVEKVDPRRFDRSESRREIGVLANDVVVGFIGTPRPHKGVDLILAAMRRLNNPAVKLLVVGGVPGDEYVESLRTEFSQPMIVLPEQPMEKMPYYLSAVDLVVLPQHDTAQARGQVPAKLFDAMAMGKPIVASAVGAIPDYLGLSGVLVPPDDLAALCAGMARVIDDAKFAGQLSILAREKCVNSYSFTAMRRSMNAEIERVVRA